MKEELIKIINQFKDIKYGNDNETRIVFATLKTITPVTTASKDKRVTG